VKTDVEEVARGCSIELVKPLCQGEAPENPLGPEQTGPQSEPVVQKGKPEEENYAICFEKRERMW